MRRFPLGAYPAMGVGKAREAAKTMRVPRATGQRRPDRGAGGSSARWAPRPRPAWARSARCLRPTRPRGAISSRGGPLKSWPAGRKRVELRV